MTPEEAKKYAKEDKEKCDELEDLAFNGAELPKGLPFHQELLFLKFRYLYQYAKLVQMPREQGKREKKAILDAYIIDKANDILFKSCGELWKNVESASSEVRKDPELSKNKKIQNLLNAIYNT